MKTILITASLLLVGLAGLATTASAAAPPDPCDVVYCDGGPPVGASCTPLSFGVSCGYSIGGAGCAEMIVGIHEPGLSVGARNGCNVIVWTDGSFLAELVTVSSAAPGGVCVPDGDSAVVCSLDVLRACPAPGTFHWDGTVSAYYDDCSIRLANNGLPLTDLVDVVGPTSTAQAAPGGASCVRDGGSAAVCSFNVAGICPVPGTFHWDGVVSGYYNECSLRLANNGLPLTDLVEVVRPASAKPVDVTCTREAGVVDCRFQVRDSCPVPGPIHTDGLATVSYDDCRVRASSDARIDPPTSAMAFPCSAQPTWPTGNAGCTLSGAWYGCTYDVSYLLLSGRASAGCLGVSTGPIQ